MERNKAFFYLIYSATFIIMIILASNLDRYLKAEVSRHPNPYTYTTFLSIYPMVIGIFIGLPVLISNARSEGYWEINWAKLSLVGLPALFFSLLYLIYFNPTLYILFGGKLHLQMLVQPVFTAVNGIMFGYTFISSFEKVEPKC